MTMRQQFVENLEQLRQETLKMGHLVDQEMRMALECLANVDVSLAYHVHDLDEQVNAARFGLEEKSISLLAMHQSVARELRRIVAAMYIFTDLERMGDQAKGIAKSVIRLDGKPNLHQPHELQMMGELALAMLSDCMQAYNRLDIELAKLVIYRDEAVDKLYANLYTQIMYELVGADQPPKTEANYQLLRAGRNLERFADLTTNVAERVCYIATGLMKEANLDHNEIKKQRSDSKG